MYNTQFKVKYNDIEEELLHKLKNKSEEEYTVNPDPEYEYSTQDVLDICSKLYRDELLSVFYVEDLTDDTFDKNLNYVYEIMITNYTFINIIEQFKKIIDEIRNGEGIISNTDFDEDTHKRLRQMIFMCLFNKNIFYITHKCICQQIELGAIDEELIVELRKKSVDVFTN